MPWTRLEPAVVVDALRVEVWGDAEDDTIAAQALDHLREQLLTGG